MDKLYFEFASDVDSRRAHLLSLSAPVTSEQTKAARNDYHTQIVVDIGWSSTLTNNLNSFVYAVRRFCRARGIFLLPLHSCFYSRHFWTPTKKSKNLSNWETVQLISMFIQLRLVKSKYLPLGCLADALL